MRRLCLRFTLFAVWLGTSVAASQFGAAFEQAKAGRPVEECFRNIDFAKVDLAEETPVLLDVLNGNSPSLARRAAGAVVAVLLFRQDARTKHDAGALAAALISHYDDADPDQSPLVVSPTDSWRQIIMYFLINSDVLPPSALVDRMLADLHRRGDAFGGTAQTAALALSHLRPLPKKVLDALLETMDESPRSRIEVIVALGANHVDDPQVIRKIALALDTQVTTQYQIELPSDETIAARNTNELHRIAASALGQIGPAAKATVPALRRIVESPDPAIEEETRGEARQAIGLINKTR